MARVITNEQSVVVEPWWGKGYPAYIGVVAGLTWWVLTIIIRQYVVEPLACRDISSVATCLNAFDISGNITAVLVAAIALFVLIRFLQPRPIIIVIASLIVLWGLAGMVNGLAWYWALGWSVVLYGLAYSLFAMIARIPLLWAAITASALIVLVTRVLLAL